MERGLGYVTGANQRKGVARMYPTRGVLPGLLRARRERPRRRATDQRDEVAAVNDHLVGAGKLEDTCTGTPPRSLWRGRGQKCHAGICHPV